MTQPSAGKNNSMICGDFKALYILKNNFQWPDLKRLMSLTVKFFLSPSSLSWRRGRMQDLRTLAFWSLVQLDSANVANTSMTSSSSFFLDLDFISASKVERLSPIIKRMSITSPNISLCQDSQVCSLMSLFCGFLLRVVTKIQIGTWGNFYLTWALKSLCFSLHDFKVNFDFSDHTWMLQHFAATRKTSKTASIFLASHLPQPSTWTPSVAFSR